MCSRALGLLSHPLQGCEICSPVLATLSCSLPAAVITSSGTAVANLLPAVVEASQSSIPLLLLTADRPSEMRDSGANQTINQVNIFGSYTRWAVDVPPPDHTVPVRGLLTTVGAAVRFANGTPAGPVHLNCQFREPLAPMVAEWPKSLLKVAHVVTIGLHYSCSSSAALLLLCSCSSSPALLQLSSCSQLALLLTPWWPPSASPPAALAPLLFSSCPPSDPPLPPPCPLPGLGSLLSPLPLLSSCPSHAPLAPS